MTSMTSKTSITSKTSPLPAVLWRSGFFLPRRKNKRESLSETLFCGADETRTRDFL